MTKVVNSWNEWDPLKRVILGRPEGTNAPAPEPAWTYDQPDGGYPMGTWGPFPQEMVDKANEQMDYFEKVLKERGIIVDRPTIHPFMFNKPVSTPEWTQLNMYGVNNVRDMTLCHGNIILEVPACQRSRWYEYLNLRPLFKQYYKEDPEMLHLSAPKPRLTDNDYVRNYYHEHLRVRTDTERYELGSKAQYQLTEEEPLFDAADIGRYGKDLFVHHSSTVNHAGIDWLKRTFSRFGIRVHRLTVESASCSNVMGSHKPRHIDADFVALRAGLVMVSPGSPPNIPEMVELFKKNDWEIVQAAEPVLVHNASLSLSACPKVGPSWISLNTLSIDEKTVCVQAGETAYCEQLDKMGFEVIPIPYEKVNPFGGGLHCTTLDVCREGELKDYFPNQVEGY